MTAESSSAISSPDPTPETAVDADAVELMARLTALVAGMATPGAGAHAACDFLCETDAFVGPLLDPTNGWVTSESMVLVPENLGHGTAQIEDDRITRYEGSVVTPGDDFAVAFGDSRAFTLQVHEYSICAFVPALAPTLVRVTNDEDFALLLQDADAAWTTGEFPTSLTNPFVMLADQCAFGRTTCVGARSLFVGADGTVSLGPGGVPLCSLDDGHQALTGRYSGGACATHHLGSIVDPDLIQHGVDRRPWMDGYLRSLAGMQTLRSQGHDNLRVSGFGGRLTVAFSEVAWSPGEPLIFHNTNRAWVMAAGAEGSRSFSVSTEMAICIEVMAMTGDSDQAISAVADHVGLPADALAVQLTQAIASLTAQGLVAGRSR